MKLALIYDPKCPKLMESAYSWAYLDMFRAVIDRFEEIQHITESCSAKDIDADVILIYDIHSSHHIEIEGLDKHPAVKYTYFNDPYQKEFKGKYDNRMKVHKLNAADRTRRALLRGVDYIICPYISSYFKHIAPYLSDPEKMLFWFPPAPSVKRFSMREVPLSLRRHKILGNGATSEGVGYDFRNWAYSQSETFYVKHTLRRSDVPQGAGYGDFLSGFAASIAACDNRTVPKYLEIPLAGCVCFAQEQEDYIRMGFTDGINCLFIDKSNFKSLTSGFLESINAPQWQKIANEGRKLIENKWTADHFASALYAHARKEIG
jgi:hypothetical protein